MKVVLALILAAGVASSPAYADDPAGSAPPPPPPTPPVALPPPAEPAPAPAADAPAPTPMTEEPADLAPISPPRRSREIVVEVPGERSAQNKLAIGATLGAGLIGGALGLYFHLESRSASDEVSRKVTTGLAWTQTQVDAVDRAADARSSAAIAYGIGGALVIGAIVAYIVTDPPSEKSVIRTSVVPTSGGAYVATGWSF